MVQMIQGLTGGQRAPAAAAKRIDFSPMASRYFRRDLAAEAAKHFKGSAEERILAALEAGEMALALFRSSLPPGTPVEEARRRLQRATHGGRRPSRANDGE